MGFKLEKRVMDQAIERAWQLHEAGNYPQAEQAYRQLISEAPLPGAWHGLGVLLHPRRGYFVNLIRPWLDYFRPGFHPFDHDTKALETRWKEQLDFAG